MVQDGLWGRNFVSLCLSNFFLFLSYYTLAATLPVYAVTALQASKAQVGLVLTAFSLAALASRPLAGPLMKRYGERNVFLAGLGLLLAVTGAYLAAGNLRLLLALRPLHGLALGLASSGGATLAALLVPKTRTGEGLGYYGMSQYLAMVIGPFFGLTLIQSVPFPVLFLGCTLCALAGTLSGLLVRPPAPNAPVQAAPATAPEPGSALRTVVEPAAIPSGLCAFLAFFAYGGLSAFAPVYANALGLGHLTNTFFAVYALLLVVPRPWFGRLFDRAGPGAVIYPGIALYAAGYWLLSQAHTGWDYLGSAAVIGTGFAALASLQALAVRSVPADRKGYATSTYTFFVDAGIATGSLLLGLVAEGSDYRTMYRVAAAAIALMAPLFFLVHRTPAGLRHTPRATERTRAG